MTRRLTLVCSLLAVVAIVLFIANRERSAGRPVEPAEGATKAVEASAADLSSVSPQSDGRLRRKEEPPETTPPPADASMTEKAPEFGWIRGRVIDHRGQGVHPATVTLHDRSGPKQRQRDADVEGLFAFRVSAGRYTLRVEEESLPRGLVPPWNQTSGMRLYQGRPPYGAGYYAPQIDVPEQGGEFSVDLRVFAPSVVAGYVTTHDGDPIEGAMVRLQSCSASAPPALEFTTTTDGSGRYEASNVYPAMYRTEVYLQEATEERFRDLTKPLPERVVVEEGGVYELPTLVAGGGVEVIEGRIVDQDGAPFEGLTVLCYLSLPVAADEAPHGWSSLVASERTDAEGRFVLRDLPSVQVKVQAASDADYAPNLPLGRRRAAFWVEPIEVDLHAAGEHVVLPTQRVDASRPFFLEGTIELEAAWARKHDTSVDRLDVRIELLTPGETLVGGPRRPSYHLGELDVDEQDGTFSWACETPYPPVRLTIEGQGARPIELVLEPEPNVTVERTFRFPK